MAGSARGYVLRLLKRRLHSRFELEQALKKRQVSPEEISELLDELTEVGLVDDPRFARAWTNDRDRFNPRGNFLLRAELMKKGIDKDLIKEVFEARKNREEEPIDELEQARKLADQVSARYRGLSPEARYRRLGGYLLRRGFTPDVVRRILEA